MVKGTGLRRKQYGVGRARVGRVCG